jgi:hypothetical protein
MTATVTVTVSEQQQVLVVPTSALSIVNDVYYVTMQDGVRKEVVI